MSQTWTADSYASGHAGQTDLANMENNFATLRSLFSGTSAPSSPVQGQPWVDTTNGLLKIYDTGNGWVTVWDIDNNRAPADKVKTASILDANVTTAKIAANAVTGAKIGLGDDGVTDANIKDATITLAKLATTLLIDHAHMEDYSSILFCTSDDSNTWSTSGYHEAYRFPLRFVSGQANWITMVGNIYTISGVIMASAELRIYDSSDVLQGTSGLITTTAAGWQYKETETRINASTFDGIYYGVIYAYCGGAVLHGIRAATVYNYNP